MLQRVTQWCSEAEFLLGPNSSEFELLDLARDRLYSWSEFSNAVEQRYALFGKSGIQRGDRIMITHGNSFEFFVDLVATLARQATVIVADGRLTETELTQVTTLSRPRFQCDSAGSLIETGPPESPSAGPALVLLTSGTSAAPKLVVLTPPALTARLIAIDAAIPRADRAVSLCLLPTHFGHGLIGVCLSSLFSGVRLAMVPRLEQSLLPQLESMITRARPSFLSGTPATWETVLRYTAVRTEKLRRAQVASASATAYLFEQVQSWAGCATYNVYGMTETASWVSAREFRGAGDERNVGDGSQFKTKFRLENVSNGIGEIFVSTAGISPGYLPEFSVEDSSSTALARWYPTGDRGHIDARGELLLAGRQGRVINRRGVKVSSEEVELAVRSLAFVADAVVIAVGTDRDSVGVLVVPKNEYRDQTEDAFLNLITAALEGRLSNYKLPTSVWFADEIPRRTNGKPDLVEIGRICGLNP